MKQNKTNKHESIVIIIIVIITSCSYSDLNQCNNRMFHGKSVPDRNLSSVAYFQISTQSLVVSLSFLSFLYPYTVYHMFHTFPSVGNSKPVVTEEDGAVFSTLFSTNSSYAVFLEENALTNQVWWPKDWEIIQYYPSLSFYIYITKFSYLDIVVHSCHG